MTDASEVITVEGAATGSPGMDPTKEGFGE